MIPEALLSPTGSGPGEVVEDVEAVRDRLRRAGWLLVATDFDGTLSEIVSRPDRARIRPDARSVLATLADRDRTTVAVVSGRALSDVRERVGVDGIAYAGNHGLEIAAGDRQFVHPQAVGASGAIETLCADLRRRLADIDGTLVEEKNLTATVHFRRVDEAAVDDVRSTVEAAVDAHEPTALDVKEGRGIVEVRPAVEWDKGRAVEWLLDVLPPDDGGVHPVYLGDDVTDEDVFRTLEGWGTTVVVDPEPDGTAADYGVDDPAAVVTLLEWIDELREGASADPPDRGQTP